MRLMAEAKLRLYSTSPLGVSLLMILRRIELQLLKVHLRILLALAAAIRQGPFIACGFVTTF